MILSASLVVVRASITTSWSNRLTVRSPLSGAGLGWPDVEAKLREGEGLSANFYISADRNLPSWTLFFFWSFGSIMIYPDFVRSLYDKMFRESKKWMLCLGSRSWRLVSCSVFFEILELLTYVHMFGVGSVVTSHHFAQYYLFFQTSIQLPLRRRIAQRQICSFSLPCTRYKSLLPLKQDLSSHVWHQFPSAGCSWALGQKGRGAPAAGRYHAESFSWSQMRWSHNSIQSCCILLPAFGPRSVPSVQLWRWTVCLPKFSSMSLP